jgi:hypothetical protein
MNNNDNTKRESIEFLIKDTDMFLKSDYNRLASHIEGHRYFLGKDLKINISWDEATFSWMSNIYQPISQVMENWTTQMSFPGRRRADVFFEICDHLYYLSLDRGREVNVYEAVLSYDANFGKALGRFMARLLSPKSVA